MIRSMTGFGTGRASVEGEELSVEVRSVNHKYCEVKVRMPREIAAIEPQAVRLVKERLSRGAIELSAKRVAPAAYAGAAQVNLALATAYLHAFRRIASELRLPDSVSVENIAIQPGVIQIEEGRVNVEHASRALATALAQALDSVERMRAAEGEAICADLGARLGVVGGIAREIEALAPRVVEEYQRRLSERVAELSRGVAVDPQRLAAEVAFFAERTDVAEELTRLSSHLAQLGALLDSAEPAGRKMDFLVQEMNREANTVGSKSQHPEISSRVVALKAEIERIREQVQNVE